MPSSRDEGGAIRYSERLSNSLFCERLSLSPSYTRCSSRASADDGGAACQQFELGVLRKRVCLLETALRGCGAAVAAEAQAARKALASIRQALTGFSAKPARKCAAARGGALPIIPVVPPTLCDETARTLVRFVENRITWVQSPCSGTPSDDAFTPLLTPLLPVFSGRPEFGSVNSASARPAAPAPPPAAKAAAADPPPGLRRLGSLDCLFVFVDQATQTDITSFPPADSLPFPRVGTREQPAAAVKPRRQPALRRPGRGRASSAAGGRGDCPQKGVPLRVADGPARSNLGVRAERPRNCGAGASLGEERRQYESSHREQEVLTRSNPDLHAQCPRSAADLSPEEVACSKLDSLAERPEDCDAESPRGGEKTRQSAQYPQREQEGLTRSNLDLRAMCPQSATDLFPEELTRSKLDPPAEPPEDCDAESPRGGENPRQSAHDPQREQKGLVRLDLDVHTRCPQSATDLSPEVLTCSKLDSTADRPEDCDVEPSAGENPRHAAHDQGGLTRKKLDLLHTDDAPGIVGWEPPAGAAQGAPPKKQKSAEPPPFSKVSAGGGGEMLGGSAAIRYLGWSPGGGFSAVVPAAAPGEKAAAAAAAAGFAALFPCAGPDLLDPSAGGAPNSNVCDPFTFYAAVLSLHGRLHTAERRLRLDANAASASLSTLDHEGDAGPSCQQAYRCLQLAVSNAAEAMRLAWQAVLSHSRSLLLPAVRPPSEPSAAKPAADAGGGEYAYCNRCSSGPFVRPQKKCGTCGAGVYYTAQANEASAAIVARRDCPGPHPVNSEAVYNWIAARLRHLTAQQGQLVANTAEAIAQLERATGSKTDLKLALAAPAKPCVVVSATRPPSNALLCPREPAKQPAAPRPSSQRTRSRPELAQHDAGSGAEGLTVVKGASLLQFKPLPDISKAGAVAVVKNADCDTPPVPYASPPPVPGKQQPPFRLHLHGLANVTRSGEADREGSPELLLIGRKETVLKLQSNLGCLDERRAKAHGVKRRTYDGTYYSRAANTGPVAVAAAADKLFGFAKVAALRKEDDTARVETEEEEPAVCVQRKHKPVVIRLPVAPPGPASRCTTAGSTETAARIAMRRHVPAAQAAHYPTLDLTTPLASVPMSNEATPTRQTSLFPREWGQLSATR